jgi:hypothetical protein
MEFLIVEEVTMDSRSQFSESDPRHHTIKIKDMLEASIQHMREDVEKVSDVRAKALFETSAEVLTGLVKAYEDFEKRDEAAWKQ